MLSRWLTTAAAMSFVLAASGCDTGANSARYPGGDDGSGDRGGEEESQSEAEGTSESQGTETGSTSSSAEDKSEPHTVLVMDDGFDPSHQVFEDKVVQTYTIACDEGSSSGGGSGGGGPTTIEELKQSTLEKYKDPDTSRCQLEEGIDFDTPSTFSRIDGIRDEWNDGIRTKSISLKTENNYKVHRILSGAGTDQQFHGTKTAGLIGYQNENVRLVLLQLTLRSSGDDVTNDTSDCPSQGDIDAWVQVHQDPKVQEAYIQKQPASVTKALIEATNKHDVDLINLSLGSLTRAGLEDAMAREGCGEIDFSEQYALEGELKAKREEYRQENGIVETTDVLTVQSAGNEGRQVDNFADTKECSHHEAGRVIAGSYDFDGSRSEFSNHGDCVDFYTLGAQVVVAAPNDFLDVVDGTSFSAPMLVRYITQNFTSQTSRAELISKLDELADGNGFLPDDTFPDELAFESRDDIASYTLTGSLNRRKPKTLLFLEAVRQDLVSPSQQPWLE